MLITCSIYSKSCNMSLKVCFLHWRIDYCPEILDASAMNKKGFIKTSGNWRGDSSEGGISAWHMITADHWNQMIQLKYKIKTTTHSFHAKRHRFQTNKNQVVLDYALIKVSSMCFNTLLPMCKDNVFAAAVEITVYAWF